MKQTPIKELIKGYRIKHISEICDINYNTLRGQLTGHRKLSYENELKIRQALTK